MELRTCSLNVSGLEPMARYRQPELMEAAMALPNWTVGPDESGGGLSTHHWVVDLILDLAGYRASADLGASVIVEPSCGTGAFLLPIVERLVQSCRGHGRPLAETGAAIRAFDRLNGNVDAARRSVGNLLVGYGQSADVAENLISQWVNQGDFLLGAPLDGYGPVDFVVGSPPHVKLEYLPTEVEEAYRSECDTLRGRADLCIGFFEKGLSMLGSEGRLAFVCSDRWMHNQYGERLRALIASEYAVDTVVGMHSADAFEKTVSAEPAITVLRKGPRGPTRFVDAADRLDPTEARLLADSLVDSREVPDDVTRLDVVAVERWITRGGPWPSGSALALELIDELEERFDPLEESGTGTRVGVGVATGCDSVYVVKSAPGVEPCRLLPILKKQDVFSGTPSWDGVVLVNPWEKGCLVDLDDYPGLAAYMQHHATRIKERYVARKQPDRWYRTIDRVDPELQARPKLLLPDVRFAAHPVLDNGRFYPHHNLYYVVSDEWDLEVLGGLLLSDITNLFVGAYCARTRGAYRFQAQYLRKIRVPAPDSIDASTAAALTEAFRQRDPHAANSIVAELYGIELPHLYAATISRLPAR